MLKLIATAVMLPSSIRLALLMACSAMAGFADNVNLTDGPPFNFRSGSDLYVRFSIWNYAINNRDSSPYPTSVGLQLLGAQPSTSSLSAVAGSSGHYYGGYQLQGWLENTDGTASAPFTNPDAMRMSLGSGSLLVEPGIAGSSNTPIAVIEADAALTLTLSEAIFGPDVATRGSSAVIHLRNLGQDLQIGLNGGYSLLSAVSEPSVMGFGPVRTSGVTQGLSVTSVPEPGSLVFLILASGVLIAAAVIKWRKARQVLTPLKNSPEPSLPI